MKPENTISSIIDWFRAAVPTPTDKNRAVQVGVHFEEVSEMLTAIGQTDCAVSMGSLSSELKGQTPPPLNQIDRKELLDALCDQIVTAVGVAHMFGMDIAGALNEVDASNWSKFNEDGQPDFDANMKIKKGPNYFKPNLDPFVG